MRLTIIGASGHGKVVAEIARLNGYDDIVFLDDNTSLCFCGGYPVIGTTDKYPEGDCFIAIGDGIIRERLSKDRKLISLIHPNAVVSNDVTIGKGTVIMPGVVINPGATIGNGCIINTSASVDHDCVIGDYVHIAVGTHLCGTVTVGNGTWIGAGSTIKNNVSICDKCIIGVGAVVVKDIKNAGVYVGIPAKKMKSK